MPDKIIGRVTHCYNKISVAVIALMDELKVGDRIEFVHHKNVFEQTVKSIELDHKKKEIAYPGDEIAIKTEEVTHKNAVIFKVE